MIICERAKCSSKKKEESFAGSFPLRNRSLTQGPISPEVSSHSKTQSMDAKTIQRPQAGSRFADVEDYSLEGNVPSATDKRIWVGGVSKSMTDRELVEFFSTFGEVEQAFIVTDDRGRSKGFAYVTFLESTTASRVLGTKNLKIGGRVVTIKAALPEAVMNKNKIYVCGLADNTTQNDVFDYFRMFGTVVEAIVKDAGSHRFAFVRFGNFMLRCLRGSDLHVEYRSAVDQVFEQQSHIIGGKAVHCERAYGSRRSLSKSGQLNAQLESCEFDDSWDQKKQRKQKLSK
jgi:cold-inducible RNA-binding protein